MLSLKVVYRYFTLKMPELPEVETVCRGISPHVVNQTVETVIIRQPQLRWCVPEHLAETLKDLAIRSVKRRGKYLLLDTAKGTLIIHLGMSGQLRVLNKDTELKKHDHVDIVLKNNTVLRFNDTRRFGAVLWTDEAIEHHPLIKVLGVEPLLDEFTAEYLFNATRKRNVPIKTFIMNSHVVVGVGNIYANEALFMAGLKPERLAQTLNIDDCQRLVMCIREVLEKAIEQGGTTLKDFVNEQGKAGYFQQVLRVYGRGGLPCLVCNTPLTAIRINNRSTVFCSECQK